MYSKMEKIQGSLVGLSQKDIRFNQIEFKLIFKWNQIQSLPVELSHKGINQFEVKFIYICNQTQCSTFGRRYTFSI